MVHCYIEIQLIFIYQPYILQTCWTHLLVLMIFLNSLGFSKYKIMSSANRHSFTSSFSVWMTFISFCCLLALARISIHYGIKIAKMDILVFFLILEGQHLSTLWCLCLGLGSGSFSIIRWVRKWSFLCCFSEEFVKC